MAIKKIMLKDDENNSYRIDFPDCYFKIDYCDFNFLTEEARIGVRGYANEYARKQEKSIGIYKRVFNVSFDNLNIKSFSKNSVLKACYEWLLKQDEFKKGEKC